MKYQLIIFIYIAICSKIWMAYCFVSGVWCSISFDPFAMKLPNIVQWMPIGFLVKGQGQTADFWKNILSISLDSLALIANFGWVVAFRE